MLRLLADDLSGALDSAAPFAAVRGAMPVLWSGAPRDGSDAALDSETRHAGPDRAKAQVSSLAKHLIGADLAFKKIDSCLRGQPAVEIAATIASGSFRTAVVAPAFPAQGRITRRGRQLMRDAEGQWRDVGVDLPAELGACGMLMCARRPEPGGGVFFCDAERDEDLEAIASTRCALSPPVLWCGAGALARALAGSSPAIDFRDVLPIELLVIGTDHPATIAQLEHLDSTQRDMRVVALALPPGSPAVVAHRALQRMVSELATAPRPSTLFATGGETLMAMCEALGSQALSVEGELMPGVPVSHLVDGHWAGSRVVSKSGGFGDPDLLRRLLAHD